MEGSGNHRLLIDALVSACPELAEIDPAGAEFKAYTTGEQRPWMLICKGFFIGCRMAAQPMDRLSQFGMNDDVEFVMIGPYSTAIFCEHKYYQGDCRAEKSIAFFPTLFVTDWFEISSFWLWDQTKPSAANQWWSYPGYEGFGYQYLFTSSTEDDFAYPYDSEWGDVPTGEMQGVAHDPRNKYWYFTTKDHVDKIHVAQDLNNPAIAKERARPWGSHWGDPDFFGTRLFIPNYGNSDGGIDIYVDAPKNQLDYDGTYFLDAPTAELVGPWGIEYEDTTPGPAWVAINPRNGHFYTSYEHYYIILEYRFQDAYSTPDSAWHVPPYAAHALDTPSMAFVSGVESILGPANFSHIWYSNKDAWIQGGAFAPSGHLYYVWDYPHSHCLSLVAPDCHPFCFGPCPYMGIYAFDMAEASERNFLGKALARRFINFNYTPDMGVPFHDIRASELEGIDVWNLAGIENRNSHLNFSIHAIMLHNSGSSTWDADNASFYHIPVDATDNL
ncbi:MAG: hypothetical protein C4523_17150 [Myxococcales bacterium]|nr:MAG: hypothetical protein C4523_17150 [Myxococcales bacterium]